MGMPTITMAQEGKKRHHQKAAIFSDTGKKSREKTIFVQKYHLSLDAWIKLLQPVYKIFPT